MDRHCSRQSPYQPSAGQVYLDCLRLKGPDDSIDERFRALELSVRPLSASELEEHHRHKGFPKRHADDRWAEIEPTRMVESRASAPLHKCTFPPAKVYNGKGNTRQQLFGAALHHAQPQSSTCPMDLTSERLWQQQSLGPSREQHGYFEFEIADQTRRVARMGLGGQKSYEESVIPQRIRPIRVPKPNNHVCIRTCAPKEKPAQQMQDQQRTQKQQSETLGSGQWLQERTNNALLNAEARQEARQRKVVEHSLGKQKFARQKREQEKREQQKIQLPPARPGNLYPGPTRISSNLPPLRLMHDNNTDQSIMSELALSVHLKSKMASQQAYRKYKEEKEQKKHEEEQRKATSSIPRSEAPGTESVKQLLASVSKVLEQKVEVAELEAAKTNVAESDTFEDQRPEPSKGLEDACEAVLKCGESFWHKFDKSHPICRQSDGTQRPPSLDSAAAQTLNSSDIRVGTEGLAPDTQPFQRDMSTDSSRTNGLRAAVEAIDKTSGDLLESPKTASGQRESLILESSAVSISLNTEKTAMHVADLSDAMYTNSSVKMLRQDVSLPASLQAEKADKNSKLREDEEGEGKVMETSLHGDLGIQLEWEEVDDSLGGDEWSDVEQDFEDDVWTRNSSPLDLEWTSDIVSEQAFEF
ncbi:MAG: hypothetical protein ALECFALPRED_008882 [Alectoria fallacina]|uniref:Uncharacterized protein n=1 Tax=Alectoria fallacina TaxID=1903189 RepID=A0A8H3PI57_9LECA|nr:MAG: hypothetical protein ALECFALPRED_008882 [Alectoria fallacina]